MDLDGHQEFQLFPNKDLGAANVTAWIGPLRCCDPPSSKCPGVSRRMAAKTPGLLVQKPSCMRPPEAIFGRVDIVGGILGSRLTLPAADMPVLPAEASQQASPFNYGLSIYVRNVSIIHMEETLGTWSRCTVVMPMGGDPVDGMALHREAAAVCEEVFHNLAMFMVCREAQALGVLKDRCASWRWYDNVMPSSPVTTLQQSIL